MKRALSLVSYASSDEEEQEELPSLIQASHAIAVTKKKRKLPALSAAILGPVHKDDPALHQGRVRGVRHVDGQFAAYIYIPIDVKYANAFKSILRDSALSAKGLVPELYSAWLPASDDEGSMVAKKTAELHVSLSRPFFLYHHQREELKRAVKKVAQAFPSFPLSFSSFATFENDERTRAFIAVDVGAGHDSFTSLSRNVAPAINSLRQRAFYDEPHFHASFAWALLKRVDNNLTPGSAAQGQEQNAVEFPSINRFPEELLPELNKEFATSLCSSSGVFQADQLSVKIGRDVFSWPLSVK